MSDPLPAWMRALEGVADTFGSSAHPSAQDLSDYVEGGLVSERVEEVRDHLVRCRSCRQVVLDLEDLPDLEPPRGTRCITQDHLDRAWRVVERPRAETPVEPGEVETGGLGTAPGPRSPGRSGLDSWLVAALLATCFGLAAWGAHQWRVRRDLAAELSTTSASVKDLNRRLMTLSRREGLTSANVQLIDLTLPSSTRGGAASMRTVRLSRVAASLLWLLDVEGLETGDVHDPLFEVQVVDQEGDSVWSESGLRLVEHGSLSFVTDAAFANGTYRLRLFSARAQVAEYAVHLVRETGQENNT